MHKITTEIKIQANIVYPISMLEQVVGKENIEKHLSEDGCWWTKSGGTQVSLDDDTFHCWEEENGEIGVESLGTLYQGDADTLMDATEQMWDNFGDEENNPIFYYTLLNWKK